MAITSHFVSRISMSQAIASPRRVEQFWAEMRSTAYLFSQSVLPTSEQATQLISELGDILGKRIITYPSVFKEFGIGATTTYKQKKMLLGLDREVDHVEFNANEIRFVRFMLNKAADTRKANWCWRITQEAEQKQEDGWYPFFVTLTVDPKQTDPEKLWKEGREFRKYIRRLVNVVCSELGHPPAHKKTKEFGYRPESDYLTYAGVIEHGKTQEHHHAHIMIWMREIPSNWKVDPNGGRLPQYRTERECRHMRQYWPWAIASQKPALYFRSKGDIWSKLGHVTPNDKETGKPIKINPVAAVGNYVTKYMQKGNKIWHHRMKCTRNLGMQKIQRLINSLDQKTLEALSWKPKTSHQLRSVSSIHSVPQGIIRSLAKRKIFAIRYQSESMDLRTLMKTNYAHYRKMLRSVRDGARPDRMPSAEFYDWVQSFLPEETGYCEERLLDSHRLLGYDFPRGIFAVPPTVIGANEIGFTQCI